MNILLIGARGSGKTTLGHAAAEAMHRPFVDLDAVALGMFAESSVTDAWAKHGEQAWRDAEADALEIILSADDQIIALGGGTPVIPRAVRRIEHERQGGRARCIYLYCDAKELARRLSDAEGDRPSLTGAKPADEIAAVLREREPSYRALADAVLDVTAISPAQAVKALCRLIVER